VVQCKEKKRKQHLKNNAAQLHSANKVYDMRCHLQQRNKAVQLEDVDITGKTV